MKFKLLTTKQWVPRGDRFEISPPISPDLAEDAITRLTAEGTVVKAQVQASDFGREAEVVAAGSLPVTRFLVSYPEQVYDATQIDEAYRQVRATIGEVVIAAHALPQA